MMHILLVIIFITFIGVGLPDSALGAAWPAIYQEFNLPISMEGYLSAIVSAGTILSSLMSTRLINRFGTGLVTAVSTLLTALALLGYAFTSSPVFFFLLAIPLGLGAGAIDTALNSFVALHYSASKMSFLHCFYGLGVAASPLILSLTMGEQGDWRRGYFIVGILQLVLTAITWAALPLWNRVQKQAREDGGTVEKASSLKTLLKIPGVGYACLACFASCGLEVTAGSWCSSYFVNTRGVGTDRAAAVTMLFYVGLAGGRALSGLVASRLGSRRILLGSLGVLLIAVIWFLLPLPAGASAAALLFLGLGVGPVFPNLIHLTPKNFGRALAQPVIGLQQATSYGGILLMPWLFGMLAQRFSMALLPYDLLALLALYTVALGLLMRKTKPQRRGA